MKFTVETNDNYGNGIWTPQLVTNDKDRAVSLYLDWVFYCGHHKGYKVRLVKEEEE